MLNDTCALCLTSPCPEPTGYTATLDGTPHACVLCPDCAAKVQGGGRVVLLNYLPRIAENLRELLANSA